jgi:glycosyltransferase involved in cell wall biosynthesis
VGADYKKVKHLLNEKFIVYFEKIERNKMPYYYNVSDIFFCLSRYEGGAPTLVVSEAMASGCLIVCAKSAEQEIIEDEKNGLIINKFGKEEADKILKNLNNKKIIKNSIETIKNISLEKWGKNYLNALIKEKD